MSLIVLIKKECICFLRGSFLVLIKKFDFFLRNLESTHCLRKSKSFSKIEKKSQPASFTAEEESTARKKFETLPSKNQKKGKKWNSTILKRKIKKNRV